MGQACCFQNQNPKLYKKEIKQLISTFDYYNLGKQFNTWISQNQSDYYKLSPFDFEKIRPLGKGSYGKVFLVLKKSNKKLYAMKIISKNQLHSQIEKKFTKSQRQILEVLKNPFLVSLHYAFQTQRKLFLVVDYMDGFQLFYMIRCCKQLSHQTAKFYSSQIILALQYLHQHNIIYRDLKPENILFGTDGHLKLIDFGLSKFCKNSDKTYSVCGTPQYIAPQIIKGYGYDKMADFFSFGCVLYDMLTGIPPFFGENKIQLFTNILQKDIEIPIYLRDESKDILKKLFQKEPNKRLGRKGIQQIKQHSFFTGINFEELKMKKINPPKDYFDFVKREKQRIQLFQQESCQQTPNQEIKQNLNQDFSGFTFEIKLQSQ